MSLSSEHFPELGFGLGLRPPHYAHIFEHAPTVDWFEVISENFMDTGGKPRRNLARIREQYPVVMHGVGMSIGTVDPLNSEYLHKLKALAGEIEPAWISDHLCWTGIAHKNTHDLLPVPYTEEALKHMVSRIQQVQDFLGRPIALENPSTYLEFNSSHIPEAEFIAEMAQQSGCHLLLDVNNVYVTCYNHRLDAKAYIDALPLHKVIQIHLSGHSNVGTHIIDTHDDHVVDDVWALYQYVIQQAGRVPNTMVEWDDKIPEWDVLYAELEKAKSAAKGAQNHRPLPVLAKAAPPYVAHAAMPLAQAQATMQEAVLPGSTTQHSPDLWIRAKEHFSATAQLGVYVDAYRLRLYEVTAEDYPVLEHYLGAAHFRALVEDFINHVPSAHFNIARYTRELPDFLMRHRLFDPFAHEIARLESSLTQLFDAAETDALDLASLAGTTPEMLMALVLRPRAALQLFAFSYPVNRYYLAVMEEQSPPPPSPEKSYLAAFRHEDVIWRMDLDAHEYHVLQLLFSGRPVGEALAVAQSELALAENVLGAKLSTWFSRWMRNGLLAAHESSGEPQARNIA